MAALPRCDELRRAVSSLEWEDMFILYCRRAVSEDLRLAREINVLCAGLTAVIEEKENFVDELDVLVDRFVPKTMVEFMKESQDKDTPNLMKMHILVVRRHRRSREWSVWKCLAFIVGRKYSNSSGRPLASSCLEGMNNGLVAEDHKFASQISALLREMIAAYDDKLDFIQELMVVSGVIAVVKTPELLNETLWKDDRRLRKLRNIEMDADKKAV
ncbi:hypothetical protein Tco_0247305 [Tanacetum coccineum]